MSRYNNNPHRPVASEINMNDYIDYDPSYTSTSLPPKNRGNMNNNHYYNSCSNRPQQQKQQSFRGISSDRSTIDDDNNTSKYAYSASGWSRGNTDDDSCVESVTPSARLDPQNGASRYPSRQQMAPLPQDPSCRTPSTPAVRSQHVPLMQPPPAIIPQSSLYSNVNRLKKVAIPLQQQQQQLLQPGEIRLDEYSIQESQVEDYHYNPHHSYIPQDNISVSRSVISKDSYQNSCTNSASQDNYHLHNALASCGGYPSNNSSSSASHYQTSYPNPSSVIGGKSHYSQSTEEQKVMSIINTLPNGGEWYDVTVYSATLGCKLYTPLELSNTLYQDVDSAVIDQLLERPVIGYLNENSTLRKEGCIIGDVILAINNIEVHTPEEASYLIQQVDRPMKILCYAPEINLVVCENFHYVKYNTASLDAPSSSNDWKPKYCVLGGVISKSPTMLHMYRSKQEYDQAVMETLGQKTVSVKIVSFDLSCVTFHVDTKANPPTKLHAVQYRNTPRPWYYIVIVPDKQRCKNLKIKNNLKYPIKIASPNDATLFHFIEHVYRVTNGYLNKSTRSVFSKSIAHGTNAGMSIADGTQYDEFGLDDYGVPQVRAKGGAAAAEDEKSYYSRNSHYQQQQQQQHYNNSEEANAGIGYDNMSVHSGFSGVSGTMGRGGNNSRYHHPHHQSRHQQDDIASFI